MVDGVPDVYQFAAAVVVAHGGGVIRGWFSALERWFGPGPFIFSAHDFASMSKNMGIIQSV